MIRVALLSAALVLGLAACGDTQPPAATGGAVGATALAPSSVVLGTAPEGEATKIVDVRKMKAGDKVTAIGRVQHIEAGFAAMRLIDHEIAWCSTNNTPWTFCCVDKTERDAALLPVELREHGEVVEAKDLGVRHLDVVLVQGTLQETEAGGLVLVAEKGWFRKERPDLSHRKIDWPDFLAQE